MGSDVNERLDLPDLLQGLNGRKYATSPDEDSKQTTIRVESDVRRVCEDIAKDMGLNLSYFVSSVLRARLLEITNPAEWQIVLAHKRFIGLFKEYGYSYRDILSELERFGIWPEMLFDCLAFDTGINLMDDEIYDYVADKFKVNKKWLKGIENRREVYGA